MKVEAGLSENRKGTHGEGQIWVIGRQEAIKVV